MILLSDTLSIPPDAVTETFAILGRRGSGKTHTASVMCEQMLNDRLQVCVIDPLDVWWGLRASADGKGRGLRVVVFGGHHADLPLEETQGTLLANLVVDCELSAIFSVRHLSKSGARRFVGDFGEQLYKRKGEAKSRSPLHLYVDEADAFVPQKLFPGTERCFGAIDTIVRRGRSSGLGTTLISQRAAVVNKDVLTQTEIMICHQTTSPQDRKALEAWVDANGTVEKKREFMGSLASLKKGEAWFWSPAWLEIFDRMKVNPRETFDSSATPKVGQLPRTPAKMEHIDVAELQRLIASSEAKAAEPKTDPAATATLREMKELRARVQELQHQLDTRAQPFDKESYFELTESIDQELLSTIAQLEQARDRVKSLLATYGVQNSPILEKPKWVPPVETPLKLKREKPAKSLVEKTNAALDEMQSVDRLFAVLAQAGGRLKRSQLALRSLYNGSGGGFRRALSQLRTTGEIAEADGFVELTMAGLKRAGISEGKPKFGKPVVGSDLGELLKKRLNASTCKLYDALEAAGYDGLTRARLATNTDYDASGGGFRRALSELRKLGCIEEEPGGARIRLEADLLL
jgi:uncharacterized protein